MVNFACSVEEADGPRCRRLGSLGREVFARASKAEARGAGRRGMGVNRNFKPFESVLLLTTGSSENSRAPVLGHQRVWRKGARGCGSRALRCCWSWRLARRQRVSPCEKIICCRARCLFAALSLRGLRPAGLKRGKLEEDNAPRIKCPGRCQLPGSLCRLRGLKCGGVPPVWWCNERAACEE